MRRYNDAHRDQLNAKSRLAYATDAGYRERAKQHADVRRARQRGATVEGRLDRDAVYLRDGGSCWICERHVPRDVATFDHVVPLSRGGAHSERNLRVACWPCNARKGARVISETERLALARRVLAVAS